MYNLQVYDNPLLRDLKGLEKLERTAFEGFEGPPCNNGISVLRNAGLQSLSGLDSLRSVQGVLAIGGNSALSDISALSKVEQITGMTCLEVGLVVTANPLVTDCSSLAPLFGYPEAVDRDSALAYGGVGVAIDIGSEGNPESSPGIGQPNGEGANSVKECIDAYAAVLPEVLIEELIAYVADLNTSNGISNALDAKLSVVERALGDANENNDIAALNAMYAFCDNAEAQRGKKLASEDVDELLASANRVIQAVDPYAALCTG